MADNKKSPSLVMREGSMLRSVDDLNKIQSDLSRVRSYKSNAQLMMNRVTAGSPDYKKWKQDYDKYSQQEQELLAQQEQAYSQANFSTDSANETGLFLEYGKKAGGVRGFFGGVDAPDMNKVNNYELAEQYAQEAISRLRSKYGEDAVTFDKNGSIKFSKAVPSAFYCAERKVLQDLMGRGGFFELQQGNNLSKIRERGEKETEELKKKLDTKNAIGAAGEAELAAQNNSLSKANMLGGQLTDLFKVLVRLEETKGENDPEYVSYEKQVASKISAISSMPPEERLVATWPLAMYCYQELGVQGAGKWMEQRQQTYSKLAQQGGFAGFPATRENLVKNIGSGATDMTGGKQSYPNYINSLDARNFTNYR